jgi:hypothetical protein
MPVEIGNSYRVTVWLRSDSPGAKANFYTEWVDKGTFHTYGSAWLAPGREWRQEALSFVATPDTKGQVYFVLQVEGPGRVWFDDVEMKKAP